MVEEMDKREVWKKWFTKDNLLILVLAGILLFIIALPLDNKKDESSVKKEEGVKAAESTSQEDITELQNTDSVSSREDYAAELERELAEVLEKVSGAGRVEVMLTLRTSRELVVEKDAPVNRSTTGEEDASGGNRQIAQVEMGETTVYSSSGDESTPYVVKTIYPVVEGVVVVAEGAGNGTVNKNLSEMVQVLFNLEAHKVKVVKMSSSNP